MKNNIGLIILSTFVLAACVKTTVTTEILEPYDEQLTNTEFRPDPEDTQKFSAAFRLFLDLDGDSIYGTNDTLLSGISVRSDEKSCITDEDGICFLYLQEGTNLVFIDASDSAISGLNSITFQKIVYPIDEAFEVTLFTEESFDIGLSR